MENNFISIGEAAESVLAYLEYKMWLNIELNQQGISQVAAHFRTDDAEMAKAAGF